MKIPFISSIWKTAGKAAPLDIFLIKWGILTVGSLLLSVAAEGCGLFKDWNTFLCTVLASPPFSCKFAETVPLLGNAGLFGLSALLVFYGGLVLLRESSRSRCLAWVVLALACVILPSFVAALWNQWLNMTLPALSLMVMGVLRLCLPCFDLSRAAY
ncbi:MAG: hypothetical protein LIO63_05955 [Akkermansia sp.]|nr:hypothetical protein [Akkermansia sp.]